MYLRGRQKFLACVISRLGMWDLRVAPCCTPCSNNYFVQSHCVRKPGRAKRWGSADFKDNLVMQSLSHMNTSGRGLRNFICFLSQNDHPPPSKNFFFEFWAPNTHNFPEIFGWKLFVQSYCLFTHALVQKYFSFFKKFIFYLTSEKCQFKQIFEHSDLHLL